MVACKHVEVPCHQRNMDNGHRLTVRSDDTPMKRLHVLSPLYFIGQLPCSRVNHGLFIHSLCLHDWEKWHFFISLFHKEKEPSQGHLHSALSNLISLSLNAELSKAVSESSSLITFHFSGSRNEHHYYLSKLAFLCLIRSSVKTQFVIFNCFTHGNE